MSELPLYEKMNMFYLGRELNEEDKPDPVKPLLYKSKYLTTHSVILGMTGSGKTGLGIAMLEEAAIDKIPAIIIDPKGDMANLLLSFPDISGSELEPWINDEQASRKGISKQELAQQEAEKWRKGQAQWDQDSSRIRRMREHTDFNIYTPGSQSGIPVSVLNSFNAPNSDVLADNEMLSELVNSAVSSLLGLIGLKTDPLKSKQHILLSSIILHYWRKKEDLGLEKIISAIITPPVDKIGVFPMERFYNQDKRMELAMQLNNILASPSFSSWTQGVPLDIDTFLYSKTGKAQHSIFSIAHLSEEERMFFVTMLLSRLLEWMRRQEGSSSLRCLLYMDEIFGYFPPSANPPSKKTMLLLLKQARAYGLGVVLATQNPVDLDYKGLANIGTWFIGRLQTKQDQDRVLGGISSKSDQVSKQELRSLMGRMKSRVFLLSSVHTQKPVLFAVRWVLSYLKGPVSLKDIGKLVKKTAPEKQFQEEAEQISTPVSGKGMTSSPPILPSRLKQLFLPAPVPVDELAYSPFIVGTARLRFFSQSRNIDIEKDICLQLDASGDSLNWEAAAECMVLPDEAMEKPEGKARFRPVASQIGEEKNIYSKLKKEFSDYLYHSQKLVLMRVQELKLESRPAETKEQFYGRLLSILQEKKELATEEIEERYRKKYNLLQTRLEKALARLEKEKGDVKLKGIETAISFGTAIFGAIMGRKTISVSNANKSARSMRSAGRLFKEKGDVARAEQDVERYQQELENLSMEMEDKIMAISEQYSPEQYQIEKFAITPRRADVFMVDIKLLWEPEFEFS